MPIINNQKMACTGAGSGATKAGAWSHTKQPSVSQPTGPSLMAPGLGQADMAMPPPNPPANPPTNPPTWSNGNPSAANGGYMRHMQAMQAILAQLPQNSQLDDQPSSSTSFFENKPTSSQYMYGTGVDMTPYAPALDGFTKPPAASQISQISQINGYQSVPYSTQPAQPALLARDSRPATVPPMSEASSCCAPPRAAPAGSSCCGSVPTPRDATTSAQVTPDSSRNSLDSTGGGSLTSLSSSSSSLSQMVLPSIENMADNMYGHIATAYPPQPQGMPVWYRYAPQYGTASMPLEQSQWRSSLIVMDDVAAAAAAATTNGSNGSNGSMTPASAYGAELGAMTTGITTGMTTAMATTAGSTDTDGFLHMCQCGDPCNCVGCLAHPYNEASHNIVQSAREYTPSGCENTPSAREFTPSDTADEPVLSANDFLFVNYPVPTCVGEESSCLCGDDCQCIGCTLHGRPA